MDILNNISEDNDIPENDTDNPDTITPAKNKYSNKSPQSELNRPALPKQKFGLYSSVLEPPLDLQNYNYNIKKSTIKIIKILIR